MRLDDKEWYVVAAVFTFHVLMAAVFLAVWAVLSFIVFLGIGWLVAKW